MKLNCDESCCGNTGNSGGGGIIRDNNGVVKTAFSVHFENETNNEAELKTILEGIRFCKQLQLLNVFIETDYCIVVD